MRILQLNSQQEVKKIMRDIKVDPYGINIMLPKAAEYVVRVNSLSCIQANILKQEMLSLGGDVAVARGALTGRIKETDCLIMGNLAQYSRLNEKLNRQPFGLEKLAAELSRKINNFQKDCFNVKLGATTLEMKPGKTYIMGIVNLTPDSFSGDGLYRLKKTPYKPQLDSITRHVQKMVQDGADIIDIGGESTRPGARPVSLKEELNRTIPVIKILAKKIKAPISIDTYKPQVARIALDSGASIVNDIYGLKNIRMIKLAAKQKCAVIIMHSKGTPKDMQNSPSYESLLDEIIGFLDNAVSRAQEAGVDKNKIIIDPGIGFGKTPGHNLTIIKNLKEFKVLGLPILLGPSRKSFIGRILNARPEDRLPGTIAACVLAAKNGANLLRVHDVKEVKMALRLSDAITSV